MRSPPRASNAARAPAGHGPVPSVDRRSPGGPPGRAFLAFVLVAAAGAGLFYGSMTPRYYPADERSHTAYAQAIRSGVLPSIDTTLPQDGGRTAATRQRIYVANHPPLFPAVQAAVAVAAGWVAIDEAELTVGRALNVLFTLAAVVALAGLGRAMTGSRRLGLLSATLFAAMPALWSLAAFGYSDGLGLLATILVVWAGVRVWTDPGRHSWVLCSAAVVLAGLSRGSALGPAVAVGALVVAGRAWSGGGAGTRGVDGSRPRPTGTPRAVAGVALGMFGPVTVIAGWWYVRNTVMFGDPLASGALLERFDMTPRPGGLLGALTDLEWWRYMFTDLVGSIYAPAYSAPPRLAPWAFWMIAAAVAVAVVGLVASTRWPRTKRRAPRLHGLPIVGVAAAVVVLGVFRHIAGGGGSHPRYILAVVALLTVVVIAGLDRLHPAGPVAAVVVMTATSLMLLAQSRRWMAEEAERFGEPAYGPPGLRVLGVGLIVVGVAGSLVVALRERGRQCDVERSAQERSTQGSSHTRSAARPGGGQREHDS